MASNNSPLEHDEQVVVVQWLELHEIKFTSTPNSTFTKSWNQKRKNYAEGLRPGWPDLNILIRPDQSFDGIGHLLLLEMKRVKGGVVSSDQRGWIAALNGLNSVNIDSVVAHGADEAIEYLAQIVNTTFNNPF